MRHAPGGMAVTVRRKAAASRIIFRIRCTSRKQARGFGAVSKAKVREPGCGEPLWRRRQNRHHQQPLASCVADAVEHAFGGDHHHPGLRRLLAPLEQEDACGRPAHLVHPRYAQCCSLGHDQSHLAV